MKYALIKAGFAIFVPLLTGLLIAYMVHHIVGFFVTAFATDEQATRLLKAYRGLIVPLADLLAFWAIGTIIWLISL